MKVYMGGKLHSIFDHATKEYIYNAKRDAEKNYRITYHQGVCTTVHNSSNILVYASQKCQKS
ncbi:hypothetical protein GGR58DRAFT_471850 [Xylaria digitata]|nr:hypothetical protein GGR58DRAFT_471850 [Xylaria digitata]